MCRIVTLHDKDFMVKRKQTLPNLCTEWHSVILASYLAEQAFTDPGD